MIVPKQLLVFFLYLALPEGPLDGCDLGCLDVYHVRVCWFEVCTR